MRRDRGNHLRAAITAEGVTQDHRHHGVSERNMHVFTFFPRLQLIIESHNDESQVVQTDVDAPGFLKRLTTDACVFWPLRAGQIDNLQLRDSLDVTAKLLRLNLDDEDAMTASRGIIFRRLTDDTVLITD